MAARHARGSTYSIGGGAGPRVVAVGPSDSSDSAPFHKARPMPRGADSDLARSLTGKCPVIKRRGRPWLIGALHARSDILGERQHWRVTYVVRELDRCIFCGGAEITEEHLMADWAHRAFARARKPTNQLRGTWQAPSHLAISADD